MSRLMIVCAAFFTAAVLAYADDSKIDLEAVPQKDGKTDPKKVDPKKVDPKKVDPKKADPKKEPVPAPLPAPKLDAKVAVREVKDTIDEFATVWTNKDGKAQDKIKDGLGFHLIDTDPDSFTWVTATGDVFNRSEWLSKVTEGKLAITGYTSDEIKEVTATCSSVWVSTDTRTSAVAVGTWWIDRTGTAAAVRVRFTASCVKVGDKWKIVSVQVAAAKK